MAFVCKKCGFQSEGKEYAICPYCGAKGSFEKVKDASALVEEIE